MGPQADHEEESEVMRVPECFEALSSDFLVSGAVPARIVCDVSEMPTDVIIALLHQDHDEQQDMTSDTTWLRVVDLQGSLGPDLSAFNVDEVDVMSSSVDHSVIKPGGDEFRGHVCDAVTRKGTDAQNASE